jgi:putative transposase
VGEGGDEVSVARFIADQRTFYAVPHAFSCRLLAVSESWFYKWIKAPTTVRGERRALLDEAVRKAFIASKRSYGSPRIYEDLIDPELPHPELVAGQSADVVALPMHAVPTAEEQEPGSDPADAVQDLPPAAGQTAADDRAEATPHPLPSKGSQRSLEGSTLVWRVSVNTVADSMRRQGLKGRKVKRNRGLTRQDRTAPKFPDLLKRDFTAAAPNLRWVGDMTEIPTDEGKLFMATVLDLCSRRLLAAPTSDHPNAELAMDAIKMAVAVRGGAHQITDVVFHTDRGSTYTATDFTSLCAGLHIRQSMGRLGSCFDNAAAESFFSTLEWEVLSRHHFRTKDEARQVISAWVEEFYNPRRRHGSAGMKSPVEFEKTLTIKAIAA